MILGIGTDVTDIDRMRLALDRAGERLARRILSDSEVAVSRTYAADRRTEFIAGRFAAKEAMAKAIGCGLGKLRMNRVTLSVGAHGLVVNWDDEGEDWDAADDTGVVAEEASSRPWPQGTHWHVSISHSSTVAVAMAIMESVE